MSGGGTGLMSGGGWSTISGTPGGRGMSGFFGCSIMNLKGATALPPSRRRAGGGRGDDFNAELAVSAENLFRKTRLGALSVLGV